MPDFIDVPRLNFEGVFPYTGSPGASAQLRRPKIAASIEKYRLTCADSGRLGKQFLRPSHFSTLVYGTRGCWLAPCPGFAAPPTTPLLWSSRLVLGEVDAHFLEIGEVLIVSPNLIALEIRLSSMSTWTFGISAAGQGNSNLCCRSATCFDAKRHRFSKPEPVVKSADKPKSIHCEPHQRKDAGNSNFTSR